MSDRYDTVGVKFDQDKMRWDLLPELSSEETAKVFTVGAKKYGDYNWKAGIKYSRLWAAARRHINAWIKGEKIDEIGTHHLANAIVNLMMALEFELSGRGAELDDLTTCREQPKEPTNGKNHHRRGE
jgi:hypothetical protein